MSIRQHPASARPSVASAPLSRLPLFCRFDFSQKNRAPSISVVPRGSNYIPRRSAAGRSSENLSHQPGTTSAMIKNFLGKIIFSRHPEWERNRETALLITAILFALVSASVTGLVIYWRNTLGR